MKYVLNLNCTHYSININQPLVEQVKYEVFLVLLDTLQCIDSTLYKALY